MFFPLIFFVSIFPYILFPLLFDQPLTANTETVKQTILFLANAHIAITLFFYYDFQFKKIIQENIGRYALFPAVAIIGTGLTYALLPDRYKFFWWAAYIIWQNWHFGRQNLGVFALVTVDQKGGGRIIPFERLLINLSIFFGSIGGIVLAGDPDYLQNLHWTIWKYSGFATWLIIVIGLFYLILARRENTFTRGLFFIFTLFYFSPQFLLPNQLGFTIYSVSHSFQYLIFMTIIAFNKPDYEGEGISPPAQNKVLKTVAVFFGIISIGGAIITIRGDFGTLVQTFTHIKFLGELVFGMMSGIVIAHFIVDAHAWRLRDAPQRNYVFDHFRFLKLQ